MGLGLMFEQISVIPSKPSFLSEDLIADAAIFRALLHALLTIPRTFPVYKNQQPILAPTTIGKLGLFSSFMGT
jgi:hypothetical protein